MATEGSGGRLISAQGFADFAEGRTVSVTDTSPNHYIGKEDVYFKSDPGWDKSNAVAAETSPDSRPGKPRLNNEGRDKTPEIYCAVP